METRSAPPPRVRRKSAYHHGNLREAVLAAMQKLILKHGTAGFTLADAARLAGVVPSALYRHFTSRDQLLAQFAADGFVLLQERLNREAAGSGPHPRAAVEAFGAAYLRFAMEHPAHYAAMFQSELDAKKHPELLAAACGTLGMLAAAAAPLTADVEALTAAIWATSHGFAQLAQAGTFKSAGLAADPEIALRATLRALVKRDPFALPVQ